MDQEKAYEYIESRYGSDVLVLGVDGFHIFWIYRWETEEDVRVERVR